MELIYYNFHEDNGWSIINTIDFSVATTAEMSMATVSRVVNQAADLERVNFPGSTNAN